MGTDRLGCFDLTLPSRAYCLLLGNQLPNRVSVGPAKVTESNFHALHASLGFLALWSPGDSSRVGVRMAGCLALQRACTHGWPRAVSACLLLRAVVGRVLALFPCVRGQGFHPPGTSDRGARSSGTKVPY